MLRIILKNLANYFNKLGQKNINYTIKKPNNLMDFVFLSWFIKIKYLSYLKYSF